MDPNQLQYRTRVETPVGPGYVDAKVLGESPGLYLVSLHRDEYLASDWETLCPANGPTTTRKYHYDDLRETSQKKVVLNTTKVKPVSIEKVILDHKGKGDTRSQRTPTEAKHLDEMLAKVVEGSIWVTSSGYRYQVVKIAGEQVKLSWVDGKYTRETTRGALVKSYRLEGEETSAPSEGGE